MGGDFSATMSRLQIEDLVRIVNSEKDDYAPEAIEAAKAELDRREVSGERLEEVAQQAADDAEREAGRAEISLGNFQWALFVLLGPFLLIAVGASVIFHMRGYRKKSKEVLLGIPLGFAFWGIIAVLMDWFLL